MCPFVICRVHDCATPVTVAGGCARVRCARGAKRPAGLRPLASTRAVDPWRSGHAAAPPPRRETKCVCALAAVNVAAQREAANALETLSLGEDFVHRAWYDMECHAAMCALTADLLKIGGA